MKKGLELIAEERKRQIEVEGYTADQDDTYTEGQLYKASMAYQIGNIDLFPEDWGKACFKQTTASRDLIKAGALLQAEIDRLEREKKLLASMIEKLLKRESKND